MKIMKNIKKAFALSAGLILTGATMFGAIASPADLQTFPSPFIKEGKFNGLIVVGQDAATQDVLGAIDVATSLQFASKTIQQIPVGEGTSAALSGDAVKIEKSTNKLEFNEEIDTIQSVVTNSDLTALRDGEIDNEFGTFTYRQSLSLPKNAKVLYTKDPEDDNSVAKPYLKITSDTTDSEQTYSYKITFSPSLKSEHNTDGNYLKGIRNKKIRLFNKEYTIIKADHAAQNEISLTLMSGAVIDMLNEGQSKTYTVKGTDYDVTLEFVTSSQAKFSINGETTNTLNEGDTFKLADGTEIGIIDILSQQFAGGKRFVEFTLGAGKLKITDTDTTSSTNGGTVSVGSQDISNLKAEITTAVDQGTSNGNTVSISIIEIKYSAGDDLYLDAGDKASEKANQAEAQEGNFLNELFDFRYEGLDIGKTEEIKLVPSSNYNYKLRFNNKAGIGYNAEIFAYDSNTDSIKLGKFTGAQMRDLVINETEAISDEEYFIASKNEYSHVMQYKDILPGSSTSDNSGEIKLKDLGDGNLISITYSGSDKEGNLNLDGNTFKIRASSDDNSATLTADFNGDGTFTDALWSPELYTEHGAKINLSTAENSITITAEKTEDNTQDTITLGIVKNSENKIDTDDDATITGNYAATSLLQNEDGSYKYSWYTGYGAYVEVDRKGSGNTQNDFKVVYPDEQATSAFFVTSGPVSLGRISGEGYVEQTQINKINVGSAVLDTDPAVQGFERAKNLIVIGGPAINRASAELMGLQYPSFGEASTIPENKAIIRLIEHSNGNVAMIIAGWTADDTKRAVRVLSDYETYQEQTKLIGNEVEVSGPDFIDLEVRPVTI